MKFYLHPHLMLTTKDYTDSERTLNVIADLRGDNASSRLSFQEILAIFEFILIGVKSIFFNDKGMPKNLVQLVVSVPAIIKFVRDVVRMINEGVKAKAVARVKAKKDA